MPATHKRHYLMQNDEGSLMLPFMLLFFPNEDTTTATQSAFVQLPMSDEYAARRSGEIGGIADPEREERRMLKAHAGNIYDLFESGMDSPWQGKLEVKEHCGPICLMPASKKHNWRVAIVSFAERSLSNIMGYKELE